MKRIGLKWSATLVCSACVLLLTASVGNAGLIPWVWNGIFGPHCPKNQCAPACAPACSPSYAPSPCGPGGCGVQSSYYAPSGCSSCGTSVCGVSSCDSGGCGPAGCPSGNCSIPTPATSARTPEPDPGVPPQTYDNGGQGATPDADWKSKSPAESPPPMPGEDAESVDAYKPEEPIPGKDPAPTPELKDGDTNPGFPSTDSPEAGAEKDGANAGPDLFNELHKVTWRPSVKNQRLTRRPTYAKARVIRRPRQAKGEWLVVPSTDNIAKR